MFKYIIGVLGTIGIGLLTFSFYRKYKNEEIKSLPQRVISEVIKEEPKLINKEKVQTTLTNHKKLSKDIINIIIKIITKINITTKLTTILLHELITYPNKIFYMKFVINYEHNVKFIESLLIKNNLTHRNTFRFSTIIMCAKGKGKDFLKLLENDFITCMEELGTAYAMA